MLDTERIRHLEAAVFDRKPWLKRAWGLIVKFGVTVGVVCSLMTATRRGCGSNQ
jgi:hypothetical protein